MSAPTTIVPETPPPSVLTDEDIIQLFRTQLPAILERRPDLQPTMLDLFFKTFARKDEVVALWEEMINLRRETRAGFERVEQHFEQVEQRFEQVDQRFDRVEQRFEQIDQRFEQVDQRFEQVEQRFEQVDQRFDRVDQRFDRVDQRFEVMEDRITTGFAQARQERDQHFSRIGSRWGIHIESVLRQTVTTLLEKSFGAKVESRYIGGEEFDLIIHNGGHILVEITTSVRRDVKKRLERKRDLYQQETGQTPARVILAVGAIHPALYNSLTAAGFEVIVPEVYEEELTSSL